MLKKKKVIIIAEAGVNHNGSLKFAKKLVDTALKAKADYIKFQTFKAESISTKNALKANYQKRTSSNSETQFQMLKKLELNGKKLLDPDTKVSAASFVAGIACNMLKKEES